MSVANDNGDDGLDAMLPAADSFRKEFGESAQRLAEVVQNNENTITIISTDAMEMIWRLYACCGYDKAQFLSFLTSLAARTMRDFPHPEAQLRKPN